MSEGNNDETKPPIKSSIPGLSIILIFVLLISVYITVENRELPFSCSIGRWSDTVFLLPISPLRLITPPICNIDSARIVLPEPELPTKAIFLICSV